jgi:hypothetical protein
MFFRPRYLSILTTRRCTAACDHCCVGASPRATQAVPVERIHSLIDEAVDVPSIEVITFTGGECVLLGGDLEDLVGHAVSNRFRTRIVTNGYWAVNERAARGRIAALRSNGLAELMLSTGTFHQRFVPVDRVITAARAAAQAGVVTRISVEACDQSTFDEDALARSLADLIHDRKLFIGKDPWISDAGGRGSTSLSHENLLDEQPERAEGPCRQILNVISVTPAQDVIACCGYPLEQMPRMRLGSIADRRLDAILADTPPELLKMWLHVGGPMAIARFVARHDPSYRIPRVASICEACVALQRDQRAMRIVSEYGAEALREVFSAFRASDVAGPTPHF